MYEDLFKDMKSTLQPMMDVAEINRKTLERMASAQSQFMSEFFNVGVNQAKALTAARDPQAVAGLQFKLFREFEAKLTESAEENLAAINEAREAINEVITTSYSRLAEKTPFAEARELAGAMPIPIDTKTSARRAAKSGGPKVEAAGPKVETQAEASGAEEKKEEPTKIEVKAGESKTEAKQETAKAEESEAKKEASTTQAEARKEASKSSGSQSESKSARNTGKKSSD